MYLLEIQIITYQDQFKDMFKVINYEWIEEYFTVTELDKKAFNNPKKKFLIRKVMFTWQNMMIKSLDR